MSDISIEEREGLVIIHIFGPIIGHNVSKFEETWNMLIEKGPDVLAINFKDVYKMDSLGISHLIKLSQKARERGVELVLYALSDEIHGLLEQSDLERFFQILTKEEFESSY